MAVLTPETMAFVQRLRAVFHPEEIILFGSRAYGTARPDSDADLLLVVPATDEPPAARVSRAASLAGEARVDAHVFPYTAEEIRQYVARGNTAVRDALARGELLYPGGDRSRYARVAEEWCATAAAQAWLSVARRDLQDAEDLLQIGRVSALPNVAFHCQQAAEKALKALIFHLGGEPERTHRLTELLLAIADLSPGEGKRLMLRHGPKAGELTPYAVAGRYPEGPGVDRQKAEWAVATARAILQDVARLIGEASG